MISICFASVTSKNYLDETIGLIYNLKKLYPSKYIVICVLDQISEKKLIKIKDNVLIVTPQKLWGTNNWRKMSYRMSFVERAYASKSALAHYIINKISTSVLLLDSDLLFLTKIDDVLSKISKSDITLFSSMHPLESWKKTKNVGIFSAGLVGFSSSGLEALNWWKRSCFKKTRVNIFEGIYNEQKYLDYMVGSFNTEIIRDFGINLSATQLSKKKIIYDKSHGWKINNTNIKVRVFHNSRVTNHKIYKKKKEFIKKAYKKYFNEEYSENKKTANNKSKTFSLNALFFLLEFLLVRTLNFFIDIKRIINNVIHNIKFKLK